MRGGGDDDHRSQGRKGGGGSSNKGVWMQQVGGVVAVKRGVDLDRPYLYSTPARPGYTRASRASRPFGRTV